jgi:hypothetical protein
LRDRGFLRGDECVVAFATATGCKQSELVPLGGLLAHDPITTS